MKNKTEIKTKLNIQTDNNPGLKPDGYKFKCPAIQNV